MTLRANKIPLSWLLLASSSFLRTNPSGFRRPKELLLTNFLADPPIDSGLWTILKIVQSPPCPISSRTSYILSKRCLPVLSLTRFSWKEYALCRLSWVLTWLEADELQAPIVTATLIFFQPGLLSLEEAPDKIEGGRHQQPLGAWKRTVAAMFPAYIPGLCCHSQTTLAFIEVNFSADWLLIIQVMRQIWIDYF